MMALLFPAVSFASCSSPAGNEGDILYNHDNHIPQFCDGSNWVAMGNPWTGADGGGCTGPPSGSAGDILYNHDNHIPQFCDGSNWVAMGNSWTGADGGGCTGPPSGSAGDIMYNSDYCVLQYCDSAIWKAIRKPHARDCNNTCGHAVLDCAGTCGGSAVLDCAGTCGGNAVLDCAGTCGGSAVANCTGVCNGAWTLGDVCSDGTIYAGTSPDGAVPMYATVCDAGQYWNGSVCTACGSGLWSGSGSTCDTTWSSVNEPSWNNGTSNNTVTGFTSTTTGRANTAGLVALVDAGSPYNAANYCKNLSAYGHADWYLPAKDELNVMFLNRVAIANFDTTDGSALIGGGYPGIYWASTEYNPGHAWWQRFTDGGQGNGLKKVFYAVRCVRR
jgi:hypothetical protein